MACVTLCARSHPVVEARPRTGSIAIKIGDSIVSLAPDEVAQLCQDLSRACLQVRRTANARRGMVPGGGIEIEIERRSAGELGDKASTSKCYRNRRGFQDDTNYVEVFADGFSVIHTRSGRQNRFHCDFANSIASGEWVEIENPAHRNGLGAAVLHRGNADLVEVQP